MFANAEGLVGGCGAPQFFTAYDQSLVTKISQLQNVGSIEISYPHQLKPLALKLKDNLSKTVKISLQQVDMKDTANTQYRHDAVVVVVCFHVTAHPISLITASLTSSRNPHVLQYVPVA